MKPKQGINFYDFRVIRKMEDKTERLEQIRLDLHNAELADHRYAYCWMTFTRSTRTAMGISCQKS